MYIGWLEGGWVQKILTHIWCLSKRLDPEQQKTISLLSKTNAWHTWKAISWLLLLFRFMPFRCTDTRLSPLFENKTRVTVTAQCHTIYTHRQFQTPASQGIARVKFWSIMLIACLPLYCLGQRCPTVRTTDQFKAWQLGGGTRFFSTHKLTTRAACAPAQVTRPLSNHHCIHSHSL